MNEFYEIKCPYCFRSFTHDQVHFRVAEQTVNKVENEIDKLENDQEKERWNSFSRLKEIDSRFYVVWGSDRGGDLMGYDKQLFYLPYIDEHNIRKLTEGGDFIRDKDGFVEKIKDNIGHFESKTRICPFCHNKLPGRYGKNKQVFISILGVSSSGKTVFVKQLLSRLQDSLSGGILSHVNGSFIEATLPVDDQDYIEIGKPLPDSTTTLNFKVPYFITLTFNKDGISTTYDFVIYDVAGETLIISPGKENKFNFFAGYIKESDAIITLIDPMQLTSKPKPRYPASRMMSTLYSVFGNEVNVPTAITLSKSDLLMTSSFVQTSLNPGEKYFNKTSPINQNISWDIEKRFFYKDEYQKLRAYLNRFFRGIASELDQSIRNTFKKSNYFAISSLLEGVDQKLTFELRPNCNWQSSDIDEFGQTFPIIKDELMQLRDDLKDQENYPEENIIDVNSILVEKSFIFDQNSDDYRKMDDILGRISQLTTRKDIRDAVYNNFNRDDCIILVSEKGDEEKLTMDDLINYIYTLKRENAQYNFNMYIQGYPRQDGNLNSLRIEEPLFWLLSEIGIINSGNLIDTKRESKPKTVKPRKLFGRS